MTIVQKWIAAFTILVCILSFLTTQVLAKVLGSFRSERIGSKVDVHLWLCCAYGTYNISISVAQTDVRMARSLQQKVKN